jgi:hypothetical protein
MQFDVSEDVFECPTLGDASVKSVFRRYLAARTRNTIGSALTSGRF